MRILHWIAVIALGFEMPVPIYWLVLHARVHFWRRHLRVGYWAAVLIAWGCGDAVLYYFRAQIFPAHRPSATAVFVGLLLIAVDTAIFIVAEMELGGRRLVGHAELTGRGELATSGLYTRMRHPRYLGMMCAVFGACILLASNAMWVTSVCWWLLALATIRLEERELRERFGTAYSDYAARVPSLLPLRFGPRR